MTAREMPRNPTRLIGQGDRQFLTRPMTIQAHNWSTQQPELRPTHLVHLSINDRQHLASHIRHCIRAVVLYRDADGFPWFVISDPHQAESQPADQEVIFPLSAKQIDLSAVTRICLERISTVKPVQLDGTTHISRDNMQNIGVF